MTRQPRSLQMLGLSLMAILGLMAFSVAGAEGGSLSGDWQIEGKLLAAPETVSGSTDTEGSLLIPNLNFALKCEEFEILEATMLPLAGGRSVGEGRVNFLGCTAWTHKTLELLSKCTVNPFMGGTIKATARVHVVRTSEGKAYVLMEPSNGLSGTYTTIEFGALCGALAEELIEVKGSLVVQLGETEAVKQLVSSVPEAVQLLFGDKLMFGTNQTQVDGSGWAFLTGANAGKKWGIE